MSEDEKALEVSRTGPPLVRPERFYISFGRPFLFGDRQVCLATEQVGKTRPDGTVMLRKVVVDAKTHEPITFLDTGTHVLEQTSNGPTTYSPVYEQQSTAITLSPDPLDQSGGVGYAELRYGKWVRDDGKEEETN